ncbi:MAG: hypothetical protein H6621_01410 [Halobacteriovoraceae bacterium]|nr:hypothetical protein [Halobacteriovoraceae bacterium]
MKKLISIALLLSSMSLLADENCEIRGAARCFNCPAGIYVSCESDDYAGEYNIKDDEIVINEKGEEKTISEVYAEEGYVNIVLKTGTKLYHDENAENLFTEIVD